MAALTRNRISEGLLLCIILSVRFSKLHGQISTHPVVLGRLGSPASLSCHSNRVPLRLCLWEQKESDKLIATFDQSNYQEVTSSAKELYTFDGPPLDQGSCGIRIAVIKTSDLQRWKCTLLARDNITAVYRGSVLLQGAETVGSDDSNFSIGTGGGEVTTTAKKESGSRGFNLGSGVGRPIVTAQGSISSAIPISNSPPQKVAPIQEVEVQSAGLTIVPRRRDRKLVIL